MASARAASRPLYRQLRSRQGGLSPEQVAASQRMRLHGAMLEAVAARGYAETAVLDVVGLAGVSTKTLYAHFQSKQGCFLATFEMLVRAAARRVAAAYRAGDGERDWNGRLRCAFDTFARDLAVRTKAARLVLVEAPLVGPPGLERTRWARRVFEWMIATSLAEAGDGWSIHPLVLRGVVSGVWQAARAYAMEGRTERMAALGGELLDWLLVQRAPGAALLDDPVWLHGSEALRSAHRTCGTGTQLTDAAGASADILASAGRAMRGAPDWPTGVRRATATLLCGLAQEPALARSAFAEAPPVGPVAVGPVAADDGPACLVRRFVELLRASAPAPPPRSALHAELLVGGVWGLGHDRIVRTGAGGLPQIAPHIVRILLATRLDASSAPHAAAHERDARAAGPAETSTRAPAPASALAPDLGTKGRRA